MSKRLALLIGNVHYQDGRLCAPVPGKDLTALADVLRDPKIGRFDDVFVQVNQTAVEVQLAIAEFFAESGDPEDVLLIYFAGHVLAHKGQPYLALGDTFTGDYLEASTIQASYLRRRLGMCPARHKLVILDCCLSGLLPESDVPEGIGWLAESFAGEGAVLLTAVQPFTPDKVSPHSHFTPGLVEGLQMGTADADGDGLISTGEWFSYAQAVAQVAEQTCHQNDAEEAARLVIGTVPENKAVIPLLVPPPETVAVAASSPRRKQALIILGVVLLLAIIAGGLYGSGLFDGPPLTEVEPSPTMTPETAVAANPTSKPTATTTPTANTQPAVEQATMTSSPTTTPIPTETKPDSKATETITPSPQAIITPSLTPSSPPPAPIDVQITRDRIFMRGGPAINFRIVGYLDKGTAVNVLGQTESGEWYNVALDDGRTGWVYGEMVEPSAEMDAAEIEIVVTIPVPVDEFYDFTAVSTEDSLLVAVGHVYVGTVGAGANFQAELLPATDLIQLTYETETTLGLGEFRVKFNRMGEGAYSSTAVRLCMVSASGEVFFCELYPFAKEW
ncbi:MAG: SH3 domain-containing protein [Chloroflexi bacterium]|nr:SH3 domain-containing protein [Chloroflexota bacterium]